MSIRIPRLRRTPKFIRTPHPKKMAGPNPAPSHSHRCDDQNCTHMHTEPNTRVSGADEDPTDTTISMPAIPPLFTESPPIKDALETSTSRLQDDTVQELLPWLTLSHIESPSQLNTHALPTLLRSQHTKFLRRIEATYPAPFVAADATRPWYVYWAFAGLSMLGDNTDDLRGRLISTFTQCQHPDGGFGASIGYYAHLATSYAAVLAMAVDGDSRVLDLIDRRAMWHWLGRMKQADGGFSVCEGGEQDIRGVYCALTVMSLLNIPLELPADAPARKAGLTSLTDGLGEWISGTQTYEGGIASRPHNEAHGGYAFCALAALCLLGEPREMIPKYLDVHALIRWMSARQTAPEGGLSGRTNKLVDACYSHWVGGCWALIDASLGLTETDLWSREGLGRYILCAAQHPKGGLRDKPSKPPDSYHTCYALAGLAACEMVCEWRKEAAEWVMGNKLTSAFGWRVLGKKDTVCGEGEGVVPLHPVFVIPVEKAVSCREYFEGKEGF